MLCVFLTILIQRLKYLLLENIILELSYFYFNYVQSFLTGDKRSLRKLYDFLRLEKSTDNTGFPY